VTKGGLLKEEGLFWEGGFISSPGVLRFFFLKGEIFEKGFKGGVPPRGGRGEICALFKEGW